MKIKKVTEKKEKNVNKNRAYFNSFRNSVVQKLVL